MVLKCLRNLLDELKSGGIKTEFDNEELAYTVGHTIGLYATLYLEWNMKFLECDFMPDGEVAVISLDNKYVLYPSIFVYRFLENPEIENSFMLSQNTYKDKIFPPTSKDFEVLLG